MFKGFSGCSFCFGSFGSSLLRLSCSLRLLAFSVFLTLTTCIGILSTPAFCGTPVSLLRATTGDGSHFFLSSSQPEITGYGSAWHTISNLGYVYSDGSSDSALVPLYRIYHASTFNHYYTTSAAERNYNIQNNGWVDQGIQGYVYPSPGPGRSPIYVAYNGAAGTHLFTQDAAEYNALSSAWTKSGVAFYVLTVVSAVDLPLLRATTGDGSHFFLSSSQPEITGYGSAWHTISSLGNIYGSGSSDSALVPLYRIYHASTFNHYYTTSAAERNYNIQNNGWVDQGIQGYVYPSPGPGRSPIYVAYNGAAGTHLFTQDAAEYNALSSAWTKSGASFYLPSSGNTMNTNWRVVGAAALQGDSHPGIFWQNQITGGIMYWTMNGTSVTGTRTLASRLTTSAGVGIAASVVTATDLDGDARPDMVAVNPISNQSDSGQVKWWSMTAATQAALPNAAAFPGSISDTSNAVATVPDNNWHVIGAADVNADSHPDLLLQNSMTGQMKVWYMNGSQVISYGQPFATIADTNWRLVGAADFNGDGHPDLLFQNSAGGQLGVWYMNGEQKTGDSGTFATVTDTNWRAISLADFNGDGHPDILFQNQLTQQTQIWLMSGATGVTVSSNYPLTSASTLGQWSSSFQWGGFNVAQGGASYLEAAAPAIDMSVLPNGSVLTWSVEAGHGCYATSDNLYLWEPILGGFGMGSSAPIITSASNPDYLNATFPNVCMFCSSHSFLADGRLFVSGGHDGRTAATTGGANGYGIPQTNLYDWNTNLWSAGPVMAHGRWYPSNCALPNGNVLIGEGTYVDGTTAFNNSVGEVYQANAAAPGSFTELSNPGASFDIPNPSDFYSYPWLFVVPNGQVVHVGATQKTYSIDVNAAQPAWTANAPNVFQGLRDYGSAVTYDPGKILVMGGNTATPSAETLDTTVASPAWQNTDFMLYPRRYCTATILADGTVLATGGMNTYDPSNYAKGPGNPYQINDNHAVLTTELWNPATGHWSTLACMETPRLYHSTAALLPDGRVLSAGGGRGGSFLDHSDAEIFSPPYLFKGTRPVISTAPTSITYGQSFTVTVPDTTAANSIQSVTFIRLSSVTHCFNSNQRINRLVCSQASTSLSISAPLNANLCPPGHYMLFLINSNGVPSVSKIIQIH